MFPELLCKTYSSPVYKTIMVEPEQFDMNTFEKCQNQWANFKDKKEMDI